LSIFAFSRFSEPGRQIGLFKPDVSESVRIRARRTRGGSHRRHEATAAEDTAATKAHATPASLAVVAAAAPATDSERRSHEGPRRPGHPNSNPDISVRVEFLEKGATQKSSWGFQKFSTTFHATLEKWSRKTVNTHAIRLREDHSDEKNSS
jgi:hypothetical protein